MVVVEKQSNAGRYLHLLTVSIPMAVPPVEGLSMTSFACGAFFGSLKGPNPTWVLDTCLPLFPPRGPNFTGSFVPFVPFSALSGVQTRLGFRNVFCLLMRFQGCNSPLHYTPLGCLTNANWRGGLLAVLATES